MNSKLLEKFYRNECTPEEVKEVLCWFEREEPTQNVEAEMQSIWQETCVESHNPAYEHDADKVFESILANKAFTEVNPEADVTPVLEFNTQQPWKKYLKLAAVLLLPVCCAWLLLSRYKQQESIKLVTVVAQPGVKKTITLADGSVVKLNSGSSLTYPASFGDTRELVLKGEAFFEVAKDSLHPFIVRTGQISTQALGTSFNISSGVKDSTISIALATGIVKINRADNEKEKQLALLLPGQQLSYNKQNQNYNVAAFEQDKVLSWKDDVLYFKDASLEEVVTQLERWYGVQIEVKGSQATNHTAGWHYTGKYDNQPLETVLQGISFVKKVSYTKTDTGTVILSFH